jgi:hypothetical protein
MTPQQKTAFLENLIFAGAVNPTVRRVTVDLMIGVGRDDHVERLCRIHRFVRDSVPYHREPVEMFHPAGQTLVEGGDCDDKAILICAMGWTLRYPWRVLKLGGQNDPGGHYTTAIGYGPSDLPYGDRSTRWGWFETSCDALPFEWVLDAVYRIEKGSDHG